MHPLIGIDLGTTHSLAAVFVDGRATVLPLEGDEALLPSLVGHDPTRAALVVGAAARHLEHVARAKTDLGTAATYRLGPHALTPVEASAHILAAVAERAAAHLGQPVHQAVITLPAWFREPQRRATQEAAERAGLEVLRLIHEPTAAALAWGLHDLDTERTLVVLDLGGGTFDVAVLDVFERIVEVRASSGDTRLGGEDVTDLVTAEIARRSGRPPGSLRAQAEQAKRALSRLEHTAVDLGDGVPLALSRADLLALCAPFTARLRACIDDALRAADLDPADVDDVLLVGGASRMPMVGRLAHEVFGKSPRIALDPDHIVARGAAVQAGLLARDAAVGDIVLTEALPHSLGVNTMEFHHGRYVADRMSVVLSRGTTLPASRSERYHPLSDEQKALVFHVVQGERRVASENERLGTLEIELPDGLEAHERAVDVRFTHDLDGLLEVEATVAGTGERVRAVLQRGLGDDVDARLARLKIPARELLPNAQALERAHDLYARLAPTRRPALERVLGPFEAALDHDDRVAADQTRPALVAMLRELEA